MAFPARSAWCSHCPKKLLRASRKGLGLEEPGLFSHYGEGLLAWSYVYLKNAPGALGSPGCISGMGLSAQCTVTFTLPSCRELVLSLPLHYT